MPAKKSNCVSCGKEFEVERDKLHEDGFPHTPNNAASIAVGVCLPNSIAGQNFWHTICRECGEKFVEAARDPVVVQALIDLLGWYVRQGIDLKACVDAVRKNVGTKVER